MSRGRHTFISALGVVASLFALYLLYRVVRRYDLDEIISAVSSVSGGTIGMALLFTVIGYVFLIGAEYIAVRYTRRPVSFARVACTAIAALGIGHSVGLSALSSGAVRYRMYSRGGMDLASLGRVILFAGLTVAIGMSFVGGIAILWHGEALSRLTGVSTAGLTGLGIAVLAGVAAYLVICALKPPHLSFRQFHLAVPSFGLACGQVVFGSGHLLSVAGVLYVSLRSFTDADYPTLVALYVGSDLSALIGHVPGGWGIIEYIVTSALEGPQLLAGLIIFRVTYYLFPMAVGVAILILDELSGRRASQRVIHSAAAHRR